MEKRSVAGIFDPASDRALAGTGEEGAVLAESMVEGAMTEGATMDGAIIDGTTSDEAAGEAAALGEAALEEAALGEGAVGENEARIADILAQVAQGRRVVDVCERAGISVATFYRWRGKYDGLPAAGIAYLYRLEAENRRLVKCLERLRFEKVMLEVEIARRR